MLEDKLIHVNSKNEKLDLHSLGIHAESNNLRDYEWSYETSNNLITSFSKGIVSKSIPFIFHCTESKANEIKNRFYEHFEYDVMKKSYGYFELNGYKYYCYLTKSAKSNYNIRNRYLELSIDIVTDKPYWIRENTKTINFGKQKSTDTLIYPFTYPFTYTGMNSANFSNDNFVESDAIIRIYGYCINPLLSINDNIYQVNTTVEEGEYVEIDTENRTVFKYSKYGSKTNIFNSRNKNYDIFRKIPSGSWIVGSNDEIMVDIVVFEKRGEPKWI